MKVTSSCNDAIRFSGGGKDGIAIVLVLGLLALVMVLAVAFSISMRVERAGAGNYAYSVGAKHQIWAALSRAMLDIDRSMHTTNGWIAYPTNNVMPSTGSGLGSVKLGWGNALKYVPDGLAASVRATPSGWIDLEDPTVGVVGRSAYLIVNSSGLLDANRVGGSDRLCGSDASEVQLYGTEGLNEFGLPDIGSVAKRDSFISDRNTQRPYETLSELRYLNSGLATPGVVSNFSVFSLSPEQKYMGPTNVCVAKVYVGGTDSDILDHEDDIVSAFRASGVGDDYAARTAFANLLDYVDSDSIPSDLGMACTELVPMINEVRLSYTLTIESSGSWTLNSWLDVEWYYPFDEYVAGNVFSMDVSVVDVVPSADNTYPQLVPPKPADTTETLPKDNQLVPNVASHVAIPLAEDVTGTGLNTASNIHVGFTVEVKGKITLGGVEVDSVPFPYDNAGLKMTFSFDIPPGSLSVDTQEWVECVDPRFNWNCEDIDQWKPSDEQRADGLGFPVESSINLFNKYPESWLVHNKEIGRNYPSDFDATDPSGVISLHVANRPLKTVGELGYLCIRPWSTIRLYDHNLPTLTGGDAPYHRVLDCFTVLPPTKTCVRGRVNLNTFETNALAAVFYKAPEREYMASSTSVTWSAATKMARDIITSRTAMGSYNQLSAIGRTTNWPLYVVGTSDGTKEAPIRNSAGLLTVRENLFTILLASGTTSKGIGEVGKRQMGDWFSYRRAVAVVWRDPFPVKVGNAQNHLWFVRYLNSLDE